jgi:hypothetical protein
MGVRPSPLYHPAKKKRKGKSAPLAPRKTSLYLGSIRSDSEEVIHVSWLMNTEG